ncbi:MAG: hypothetical protein OXE99_11145 [Cellvibrionales bacterium]|nr:hypothetical protein [Cellvibrionales bacterium]
MKVTICRFSTHQTAKVFAILTVISSLIFFCPISLLMMFSGMPNVNTGAPFTGSSMIGLGIIMPIFQGIFAYLFIRFSLWLYNKLYKRIGGIAFETID